MNRCEPLGASGFVKLPQFIEIKRAVINIRSDDDACFAWSVVAAMYPAENNVTAPSSYPDYERVLDWSGLSFPMTLKQIPRFERINEISINVFVIDEQKIAPLRLTKRKRQEHVNLLMIDGTDCSRHFCWIKDFSRLISSQLSKHNGRVYVCDRCLHVFHSENKLTSHTIDCEEMNDCRIELPKLGENVCKFTNFHRRESVPFVIYADFECLLKKLPNEGDDDDTSDEDSDQRIFT